MTLEKIWEGASITNPGCKFQHKNLNRWGTPNSHLPNLFDRTPLYNSISELSCSCWQITFDLLIFLALYVGFISVLCFFLRRPLSIIGFRTIYVYRTWTMLHDCSIVLNNTKCFLATGGFVLTGDPKLFFFSLVRNNINGKAKMARNINKTNYADQEKGPRPT